MNTKVYLEQALTEFDFNDFKSTILKGGLIVFPTETVYGLGGNGLDDNAAKKIYEAKGRPSDNPLILHISNETMLKKITKSLSPFTSALIEAFWPGPLTMVFHKSESVPMSSTGGLHTVAVRMPRHPLALKLIESCGVPLAAPSANLSGRPSSTEFSHVYEDLNERVEVIIDGGDSVIGLESTVLDMTSTIPTILRPGVITQKMIEEVLEMKILRSNAHDESLSKSPGTKYAHYQPKAPITLLKGNLSLITDYLTKHMQPKEGVITFDIIKTHVDAQVIQANFNSIYKSLRWMDTNQVQHIWVVASHFDAFDEAVKDRLLKATHHQIKTF
jgi:L-threonylcarbamoyladenylate synthase